jgi:hypothetical protein
MSNVTGIRLFGSAARGQQDTASDTDILVTYRQSPTAQDREEAHSYVQERFNGRVELAEYTDERICSFYRSGDLFAWHLHHESRSLRPSASDLLDTLGRPAKYESGKKDVQSFITLLHTAVEGIASCDRNATYEAGLIYLASRNVAMSASWYFLNKPDFSRSAALNLSEAISVSFPLSVEEYEHLIHCRHASQRGTAAPHVDPCAIQHSGNELISWARIVGKRLDSFEG